MIDQSFTPHQAASQLAISPATVRRWCADHAAYLSPGANPDKGVFRRLSQSDIEVLQEVKRLRSAGLSPSATNDRLAETVFPAPITEAPQNAQEGLQREIAPIAVIVDALRSATAPLEARQEAQEARLQALEAQRLRIDAVYIFIAGLVIGLVIASAWAWFR